MAGNILVTGGAGYIGSHTCKALANAGFNPVTVDDYSQGHDWAVRWGPAFCADIANQSALTKLIKELKIEAAIHFAAFAYVGESMNNPGKYFRNNVTNTLSLLETLEANGVNHLVFSSSCATYGIPNALPIAEQHPQVPINPYGESKLFIEKALRWFEVAHGLRSVSLRYFNAAGADAEGEIGEAHNPETHLIPLALSASMGELPEIEVYGTDYPTPDGTAIRDYIHVTDLADAHVKALQYLRRGGRSVRLNIGTGKGASVREVVAMIESVTQSKVPVSEEKRREGDPAILVADQSKAQAVLGWSTSHSDLETIIETAWRWQKRLYSSEGTTGRSAANE